MSEFQDVVGIREATELDRASGHRPSFRECSGSEDTTRRVRPMAKAKSAVATGVTVDGGRQRLAEDGGASEARNCSTACFQGRRSGG